ncbi:MAG TPA: single-stranded-DNA-specific exonuclease RecJ [Bauldia sp.]|nr:single-stranded-DNA-specific exonuclease RecJ [Bauldia sp.]
MSIPLDPNHPGGRPPAFLGVERSLTGRRWVERLDAAGRLAALTIAQRNDMPDIVARVLAGRGISPDEAERFLDPTLRALMPDPSTLADMDVAAERVADAVMRGEKVAIFGDYDVDGATSSAVMTRFLRHQGLDPVIYIPDRLFEGYGPNVDALQKLAASGITLVIAVDCGSSSPAALEAGRGFGLDIVVLDHHQLGVDLPPAVAVVNPNRQDDLSGLGYLAAVGITFLATVAVNRTLRRRGWYAPPREEPDLLAALDLVALGTVCDVVPLRGLNRAFVAKGLIALAGRRNRGIAALSDASRLGGPLTTYHLGFALGPRINAGGRIGDAALGARLLVSDDAAVCEALAAELDRLNQERQAIETVMLEEAMAEAAAEIGEGPGPSAVVTGSTRWHPGVVGLIASRLKDRFGRPAIAVAFQPNGIGMGSARSIAGVDIGHAVRQAVAAGILEKGGGHAMAAGITVEKSRLADFRAFLEASLSAPVHASRESEGFLIDAALSARGATIELLDLVERAGPFGAGHPEPVFVLPAHRVAYAETVGNGHLRLALAAADGATLRAMAFRAADTPLGQAVLAARGRLIHVAGPLSVDTWQGRRQPAMRLTDAAEVVGD